MADSIILTFKEESFNISKSKLVNQSEFFKTYFDRWDDRIGGRKEFVYDDKSADAFRGIYNYIISDDFLFRDIDFSNLDESLELADFLLFNQYMQKIKQLLVDHWQEAEDAITVFEYIGNRYPDERSRLVRKCAYQVMNILHGESNYSIEKSYAIVLHAAANLKCFYVHCNNIYDSEIMISNALVWLVKNHFTKEKIQHVLNNLCLEIFPSRFLYECLESMSTTNEEDLLAKKWIFETVDSIYARIGQTVNNCLSCIYVFEGYLRKFQTLSWKWQENGILIKFRNLFASHMIDETVYFFFDHLICIMNLNTMQLQENIISYYNLEDSISCHVIWSSSREILNCNDDRYIYLIPNVITFTHLSTRGLRFDLNTLKFSLLPVHFEVNETIRSRPLCYQEYLYLAVTDTKYITIYRYEPENETCIILCRKNIEGFSGENMKLCMAVSNNNLHIFCFVQNVYCFSLSLDTFSTSDLVELKNEHLEKWILKTTPHIIVCQDSFVILLEIIGDDQNVDFVIINVKDKILTILGYIPRCTNNSDIISLISA